MPSLDNRQIMTALQLASARESRSLPPDEPVFSAAALEKLPLADSVWRLLHFAGV
jgi:hypothetical protein